MTFSDSKWYRDGALYLVLTISRELGTEIVTIIVRTSSLVMKGGTVNLAFRKKHEAVHKALLCAKCPVFDKMFNSNFMEGTTQSATLPDDDSVIFELFLTWVPGIIQKVYAYWRNNT